MPEMHLILSFTLVAKSLSRFFNPFKMLAIRALSASKDLGFRLDLYLRDYITLGVRYQDLQARVFKQETRNLTTSVKFRVSCLQTRLHVISPR